MGEVEQLVNLGGWGYAFAAIGYLLLAVLLITSWRGRVQGALLLAVAISSAVWAAWVAISQFLGLGVSVFHIWLELLRDGCVLLFLFKLATTVPQEKQGRWQPLTLFAYFTLLLWFILLGTHTYLSVNTNTIQLIGYDSLLIGHMLLTLVGLILIEQLFRNTHPQERWAVKFLYIGLGSLFVYDFFMYSSGVLFGALDLRHWEARGFIHMLIVPLIAVSAARNPQWSVDVFVSRRMVFHTAAILAAGIYLIAMAFGGYAIGIWGGSLGGIAQFVFLFAAALILLALMVSGQVRAYIKVFLSKNFFNYKYDYRDEWLKLINELEGDGVIDFSTREHVIRGLANIVDSPGGALWLAERGGKSYRMAENLHVRSDLTAVEHDALTEFLSETLWLLDLNEYRKTPEVYGDLRIPDWLEVIPQAWLVIPLFQNNSLFGFILLLQPRAQRSINWEDRDLLKTAASQVSSYLALSEASAELADARQFEAFNRLSAYVVHDLKNVVGQLSLVVANSKKFSNNQEFVEDAFDTVDNAVAKMQKMLGQLRQGKAVEQTATAVKLMPIVNMVVKNRLSMEPQPALDVSPVGYNPSIIADGDRLEAVIEHMVQNAQEATPKDGIVKICLINDAGNALVEIADNGSGMEAEFIKNRLFRPFDTTKGNAGMGIGAYESREYIRALGGDILVESEPGQGTVFRLKIPVSS